MTTENTNGDAFIIHISGFVSYIFLLGGIIAPFLIWKLKKENNEYIDHHAKEAINFNISFVLYNILIVLCFIPFVILKLLHTNTLNFGALDDLISIPFQFPLLGVSVFFLLTVIKVAFIIIAALKANKGEYYTYPFSFKFIK